MIDALMYGFTFTDFYNFVHDIVLLILIFRAGKDKNTAVPNAKGRRL